MQLEYTIGGRRAALTARAGQTLLEALREAGAAEEAGLAAPCGGAGRCGKCRVLVEGRGWVLACQTPAEPGMTLRLPAPGAAAVLREGTLRVWETLPPLLWPELAGSAEGAAADGLADGVDGPGGAAGADGLRGTDAPRGGPGADGVDGPDGASGAGSFAGLGAAVDLGTTTVVVHLHDLATGRRLGSLGEANAQRPFGADLIRRIAACEGDGLAALSGAVRRQLARMTAQLLSEAKAGPGALRAVCVAGNTVMLHILAGLSPASLGLAPYTPVSLFGALRPDGCGVAAWRGAQVWLCPCAAGYFGGDLTAGMLACGLTGEEESGSAVREAGSAAATPGRPDAAEGRGRPNGPDAAPGWRLLLDIGTNGEMALAGPDGTLLCCATAAGPAFEGAEIRMGMAGAPGAVCGMAWGPEGPRPRVLGGGAPRGICGSGLIETLAELRRVGAVDGSGRLLTAAEAEAAGLEELADWLEDAVPEGAALPLPGGGEADSADDAKAGSAPGAAAGAGRAGAHAPVLTAPAAPAEGPIVWLDGGRTVYLTQGDIRRLQLAKAAIAAGVRTLLRRAGIRAEELARVELAGGFGSSLSPGAACAIGLLPPALARPGAGPDPARVRAVGNAAGEGAALALLRADARAALCALAARCQYIELATDPDFQQYYLEEMHF